MQILRFLRQFQKKKQKKTAPTMGGARGRGGSGATIGHRFPAFSPFRLGCSPAAASGQSSKIAWLPSNTCFFSPTTGRAKNPKASRRAQDYSLFPFGRTLALLRAKFAPDFPPHATPGKPLFLVSGRPGWQIWRSGNSMPTFDGTAKNQKCPRPPKTKKHPVFGPKLAESVARNKSPYTFPAAPGFPAVRSG